MFMTPKEKANELFEQFGMYVNGYVGSSMLSNFEFPDVLLERQKEITIKVIDTIMKSLQEYGNDTHELQNMDAEMRYWNQVKEEIKNK